MIIGIRDKTVPRGMDNFKDCEIKPERARRGTGKGKGWEYPAMQFTCALYFRR